MPYIYLIINLIIESDRIIFQTSIQKFAGIQLFYSRLRHFGLRLALLQVLVLNLDSTLCTLQFSLWLNLLERIYMLQTLIIDRVLVYLHLLKEVLILPVLKTSIISQYLVNLSKSTWSTLQYAIVAQQVSAPNSSAIDSLRNIAVRSFHQRLFTLNISIYCISIYIHF